MPIDFDIVDVTEDQDPVNGAVVLTTPNPVALFGSFQDAIDRMRAEAAAVVVTDDTSHARAVEMAAQAKQVASRIESTRKEAKAPYLEACQQIDGFARPLVDTVKAIGEHLNQKATPYLIEKKRKEDELRRQAEAEARALQAKLEAEAMERARVERERLEAEARARAEAERQRLEAEAKARRQAAIDAGQVPVAEAVIVVEPEPVYVEPEPVIPIVLPPIVPARTEVKTDSGTARLKTVTKFEIVDIQGLPTECFAARADAIIKAVEPWVNAQVKAGRRDIPGVRVYDVQEMKTTTKRGF